MGRCGTILFVGRGPPPPPAAAAPRPTGRFLFLVVPPPFARRLLRQLSLSHCHAGSIRNRSFSRFDVDAPDARRSISMFRRIKNTAAGAAVESMSGFYSVILYSAIRPSFVVLNRYVSGVSEYVMLTVITQLRFLFVRIRSTSDAL